MGPRLEFFFDYGSPYSYLADTQLGALCDRTGAELSYRPMLVGAVFKATGNRSPFEEPVAAKRAYGGVELQRWVAHYGVDFPGNAHFPINTLQLMRAAHAALKQGVFPAYHAAIYRAFWGEGRNLGEPAEVARVLDAAGVDATPLLAAAAEPAVKEALRATTDEAVARGAFGAPTFFVGDEMFFGADRLPFVERALAATAAQDG